VRFLWNFLKGFWDALVAAKNIVTTLVFLAIIVLVARSALHDGRPAVPDQAALVLRFDGFIVEQASAADPLDALLSGQPGLPPETRLRDIVEAIDRASEDKRIRALALELDYFMGAGPATLESLGAAIRRFRASGKPVVAYGQFLTGPQYYVAAQANEVMLNPMGAVLVHGYGVYELYLKDVLERLKVDVNVFRVGKYKSFVEPFTRSDMSPEAREAASGFLSDLWGVYTSGVEEARRTHRLKLTQTINAAPEVLARYQGDLAAMAKGEGAVDALATRDGFVTRMTELVGEGEDADGLDSFSQIDMDAYLAATRPLKLGKKDKIAVIYVVGDIIDGDAPPGIAGSDTIVRQIRETLQDTSVKGLVVRIDSPGGSATAAEQIRDALQQAQRDGMPVVTSMSTVAASGGYWIASTTDEIWAQPTTITGSIGIFGIVPTFNRALDSLGVHSDGVGTTRLSDATDITRPLSPEVRAVMQSAIEHGYRQFIDTVARGRRLSPQQVDQVAQGRPWSGAAARQLRLVDRLGDLEDATQALASRLGLEAFDVQHVEQPKPWQEVVLEQFITVRQPVRLRTPPAPESLVALARSATLVQRFAGSPAGIAGCIECAGFSVRAQDAALARKLAMGMLGASHF